MRTLLLWLSESERLKRFVIGYAPTRRMSRRFVAGERFEDALDVARRLNAAGRFVSFDLLGENVRDRKDAIRVRDSYLEVYDRIAAERINANVSLKLTHLGLDMDQSLCESLLESIVGRAATYNNFLRIDMESSAYTSRTIEICSRLRAKYAGVGTVMQAYLYRTEEDIRRLLSIGCRIRLCKGAYKEPAEIAFPKKSDVDTNYIELMTILLPSGVYHGIATHDRKMISATKQFAADRGISRDQFEFQMLYGIRTDLQQSLIDDGYRLRVYVPFGDEWFPYFMRRLAERPANLMFFLRSLVSKS